ncbi:sugar ABC transporter ATP-binding protein [Lacticaseibacillus sp. GG6-2]
MVNVIEMKKITKDFSGIPVLRGVDLTVRAGSIHALLGENGTGKSTLMNILCGLKPRDGGEILFNGETIEPMQKPPRIAFIHQELSLVNDLPIYQNLFLGHELSRRGVLAIPEMVARSKEVLGQMALNLDPWLMVRDLNPALKQTVEIARGLNEQAQVIIMDEPTASLDDVEIKNLFTAMRVLRKQGVTIVFISHKLSEVMAVCDHYTVMRDGRVVGDGDIDQTVTERSLSDLMVGKKLTAMTKPARAYQGEPVLTVKQLSKAREFRDVSLHVDAGEVVGFFGLLGDGRSELFQTIVGANGHYNGTISVAGRPVVMHNTATALRQKIAYIPKNRKENGIVKDLSVSDNVLLPVLNRLGRLTMIMPKKRAARFKALSTQVNVKYGQAQDLITTLSGGNQQKVLIARALSSNPKLVVLDNPTQGVDIGAKAEIYTQIQALAAQGVGFAVLTNEFDELERLCDRVYVMAGGQIVAEVSHDELNEADLMYAATGGTKEATS